MALMPPHRWLCRCLAPDGLCPTVELTSTLDTPDFAWEPLLVLAHRHFIAAPWYAALQRRGLLERLPVEISEHLAAVYTLSLERNQLLRRELLHAARAFNALGVEPLLLKGAMALLPDQLPETAVRLMGDLDVLVPADRLIDSQNALKALGYYDPHEGDDQSRTHHHAPPLVHRNHGVKFELHHAVLGRSLDAALPAAEMWRDSQRIPFKDTLVRTPSLTHRVLHNGLHTLLQDSRAEWGLLELRQLLDLAQWRAGGDGEIDWPLIRARFTALGKGAVLEAYPAGSPRRVRPVAARGTPSSPAATWLKGKFEFGIQHPGGRPLVLLANAAEMLAETLGDSRLVPGKISRLATGTTAVAIP